MNDDAASEEAAREDDARLSGEEIRATEAAAAQPASPSPGPSPGAEIAPYYRSGRQHDHTDTAVAYQRAEVGRRGGPRR